MTVSLLDRWSPRDLPWRRTRDPWAVMVSELMLQQTQVARVVPKYEAFMALFPTPAACAAAPRSAVIDAWKGLGYNRRAVNLHRAAAAIDTGPFPDTLDDLLALPGIGPYTARAVLAFAYERDVGVVDVNVGRVIARWEGRALRSKEVQTLADAAVPSGEGWRWNQMMLDLGATICTARVARCDGCPAWSRCSWRGEGDDPAVGSAATTRSQSTFEGSDRQGRGRLVDALRLAPVPHHELAVAMGWPDEPARAEQVFARVLADGLAEIVDGVIRLPE